MNTMNAGLRNLGSQTKFQYSQVYRYDLFNRLVSAQTYELDQSQAWTSTDKWLSNYKYDLNGNSYSFRWKSVYKKNIRYDLYKFNK